MGFSTENLFIMVGSGYYGGSSLYTEFTLL